MNTVSCWLNDFAIEELERMAKRADANIMQVAASVLETWALRERRVREEVEAAAKAKARWR